MIMKPPTTKVLEVRKALDIGSNKNRNVKNQNATTASLSIRIILVLRVFFMNTVAVQMAQFLVSDLQ